VDNRVEAPSRTPGEGSGSSNSGEGSEATAGANGQASSSEPAKPAGSPATRPSKVIAPSSAPLGSPSAGPSAPLHDSTGGGDAAPSYIPAGGPVANGSFGSSSGGSGSSSGGTSPMAAVSGVASSARGLAAKVGASLSGLTTPKPKPKGKPRPKGQQVRRPGPGSQGSSLTRPQQGARPQPGMQQSGMPQQSRSALLSLQRIETMSVMKFSFLISLVAWVALFVAVAVLYFSLSKLGVFAKIEQTVGLVTYNKNHPGSNAASWFKASRVLEYTALVCTINAILFTALATVGAALYNLVTNLTGGIEVTLRESD
jgi:hypothetical protein